jgi:hypothetical protein
MATKKVLYTCKWAERWTHAKLNYKRAAAMTRQQYRESPLRQRASHPSMFWVICLLIVTAATCKATDKATAQQQANRKPQPSLTETVILKP